MCHRITPLLFDELQAALDEMHETGHARLPRRDPSVVVADAYPGMEVPLFVADDTGRLVVAERVWGFDAELRGRTKRVFNTRMETALLHARSGRGMWAKPIVAGRCLVPVRSFYESWTRSRERRGTDVRFECPGFQVFLLAGVCDTTHFSVVTTTPNADVAPIHTRMPVVLGPGESSVWLGPDYATLADRSRVSLVATAEE